MAEVKKVISVGSIEEFKKEVASYDILQDFLKEDINAIKACISLDSPVLLVGETGLGKTTLISELAKQNNKNLTRLSVHSGVTGDEILGKFLAKNGSTVWQDGLLIQAMKSGEWIVFDEINACPADVLFALHSLLDDDKKITLIEKDGEVIRPHKDFRFFATMNPIEDYAGTKELNMAFFSRFGSVIKIKPFGVDIEINILQRKGVSITVATRLVSMANNLRQHKKNDDIIFFCGTRDLIHTGKLMHQGMQESNAIHYGILNKMSKDDKAFVLSKNINLIVPDPLVQKLTNEILDLNNKYAQSLVDKSVQENQIKNLQQNLQQAQQAQAVDQYNLSDDIKKALKILGIL